MTALSEKRKGEVIMFFSAFLNGFLPVVIVLSYSHLSSLVSLFWSTLFAAGFLLLVVSYKKRWHEMRNAALWKYGILIALSIGVGVYGLYFWGLETTTPGNASIIILFEVLTSFVFFRVFKGERFSADYAFGAILMIIGAGIVLAPNFSGIHFGDLLIFAATLFSPLGNFFQQKARVIASSESVMFLRSAISAPLILILAVTLGAHATPKEVMQSLPFLLVNGILLLGFSKVLWIEAIHRMTVTKATALASLTPFVTLIVAWSVLGQVPTVWQLLSLVPLVLGVLLLTDQIRIKSLKWGKWAGT